jgi:penicillin amidase
VKGLQADATIEREANGMLHVKASNRHDVFFAQGVAMAQERLWQLEFMRRLGRGALSEVLGNATLDTDRLILTLGFFNASEASVQYMTNDSMEILTAFADGVNSYLDTKPPLPLEFKLVGFEPGRFTPADGLNMIKFLSLELAGNFFREIAYQSLLSKGISAERIMELNPPYPLDKPTILSDDEIAHINFTGNFDPIDYSFYKYSTNPVPPPSEQTTAQGSSAPKINIADLIRPNGIMEGLNLGFKSASNNWVISGSHTATGKPLLCNDPHLQITTPSIWLLMHLECPDMSVVGATAVGLPGVTIGRNQDIAWGVTNTFVDVQDTFILETSPDGNSYKWNGSWYDFAVRTEIIKIKGQPDFTLNVKLSRYGPVVSDVVDMHGLTTALMWTSLDDKDTTFNTVANIANAKNFDDFRNSFGDYVAPAQNWIYADVSGNIGYQCPGKIPVRVPGHSGMFPIAGNGSYDWVGYIPFEELPYTHNPSKGYIVTANNKLTPPSYPYLLLNNHDWDEGYRAYRIVEMINETQSHTVETQKNIQYNQVTGLWKDFEPVIADMNDELLTDLGKKWKASLLEWDGNETPDSVQATMFEFWFYEMGRLGNETQNFSWDSPIFILNTLANDTLNLCGGSCNDYTANSLTRAISLVGNKDVSAVPKWGDEKRLTIQHMVMSSTPVACLFQRIVPFGGDSYAINVGAMSSVFDEESDHPFKQFAGPSYRHIVDLSNMDNSQFVIPMGQSGNLLDKNYESMLDDFLDGKYIAMKTDNYHVSDTITLKA